MSVFEKGIRWV